MKKSGKEQLFANAFFLTPQKNLTRPHPGKTCFFSSTQYNIGELTNKMENETNMTNWLEEENNRLQESRPDYEERESLKFEENKIVVFEVQWDKGAFQKWVDPTDEKLVKKIIPVLHDETEKNLWLNVKNPLYAALIKKGLQGEKRFSVLQTGKDKGTKYTLIE